MYFFIPSPSLQVSSLCHTPYLLDVATSPLSPNLYITGTVKQKRQTSPPSQYCSRNPDGFVRNPEQSGHCASHNRCTLLPCRHRRRRRRCCCCCFAQSSRLPLLDPVYSVVGLSEHDQALSTNQYTHVRLIVLEILGLPLYIPGRGFFFHYFVKFFLTSQTLDSTFHVGSVLLFGIVTRTVFVPVCPLSSRRTALPAIKS